MDHGQLCHFTTYMYVYDYGATTATGVDVKHLSGSYACPASLARTVESHSCHLSTCGYKKYESSLSNPLIAPMAGNNLFPYHTQAIVTQR